MPCGGVAGEEARSVGLVNRNHDLRARSLAHLLAELFCYEPKATEQERT